MIAKKSESKIEKLASLQLDSVPDLQCGIRDLARIDEVPRGPETVLMTVQEDRGVCARTERAQPRIVIATMS
ncbi:uncharacterized protein SCHCODRAFT_01310496 [Schizophyllum commune H4-8]|uniref:uncharacterized protein n=1 Tax=Schizophyllum commune (strain H4-8 / FGSC 9210) TaxID=578458 RepID=UPI002160EC0C|nr:uncharacterized protein SCHCODRAFT_01310496 [Schizophyllum commune H4-8]KAI5891469.1 hypothetical protein SCHCODRAFT_01310496 [Schizophyllum commune H4-8]